MSQTRDKIIVEALKITANFAIDMMAKAKSWQYSQPHPGAIWFSFTDGVITGWQGQVVSAYFHPTKEHSATTVGKLGQKTSKAAAGQWAVSMQTKALFGNKAMYNTLD
jgi:hypothetical protein